MFHTEGVPMHGTTVKEMHCVHCDLLLKQCLQMHICDASPTDPNRRPTHDAFSVHPACKNSYASVRKVQCHAYSGPFSDITPAFSVWQSP